MVLDSWVLATRVNHSVTHQTFVCGLVRLHTKPGMKPWIRKPIVSLGKLDPPTANMDSDCWALFKALLASISDKNSACAPQLKAIYLVRDFRW